MDLDLLIISPLFASWGELILSEKEYREQLRDLNAAVWQAEGVLRNLTTLLLTDGRELFAGRLMQGRLASNSGCLQFAGENCSRVASFRGGLQVILGFSSSGGGLRVTLGASSTGGENCSRVASFRGGLRVILVSRCFPALE